MFAMGGNPRQSHEERISHPGLVSELRRAGTDFMAVTLPKDTIIYSSRTIVSDSDGPAYAENKNCEVSDTLHPVC